MTSGRKLWLAVAVLAVAALASSQMLGAMPFGSHVTTLEQTAVIGGSTPLLIEVAPIFVGGAAELYVSTPDDPAIPLGSFPFTDVEFVLDAAVPQSDAGDTVTYFFKGTSPGGLPTVSNGAPVLLKTDQGTDEPPAWK